MKNIATNTPQHSAMTCAVIAGAATSLVEQRLCR